MAGKNKTIRFRKGNKTLYWQDFRFMRGLPHGVDFRVTRVVLDRHNHYYVLSGYGYGEIIKGDSQSYGNGSLYVHYRMSKGAEHAMLNRIAAIACGPASTGDATDGG